MKPTLHGDKITLRPFRLGDLDAYFAMLQDEEGSRLTGTQQTFTREQAAKWLERVATAADRIDCAIVVRATDEVVGEVVLNDLNRVNRWANVRIALSGPQHYGKGYGSEALRLLLAYGFDTLELHRIELEVYSFNPRALHVYEKLGFTKEGVRREVLLLDGQYHDAITMSLLRREFDARRQAGRTGS